MYLIVGLGNPGKKYEKTRHNIGFMVLDKLSSVYNQSISKSQFKALISDKFLIENQPVILVKPQTYMNLSGESIIQIINFYKIQIENTIVIYDELALPAGKFRIRPNGSAGGHNGIKSTINSLGNPNFTRIRIGIGTEAQNVYTVDYVLQSPNTKELNLINQVIDKTPDVIREIIMNGVESAMNKFN